MPKIESSSKKRMRLAEAMGLRPLDRVQLNQSAELREIRTWRGQNGIGLPFFYFQRIHAGGKVEIRSPSGYAAYVPLTDICDTIPGKTVIVKAMPWHIYHERSKLPLERRGQPPGPECFFDAYVLYVTKDRWNCVDEVHVEFFDPSLNAADRSWPAPIVELDRAMLQKAARRTLMPVLTANGRRARFSADQGVDSDTYLMESLTKAFFEAALKGDRAAVEQLSIAGAGKMTLDKLRAIRAGHPNGTPKGG